MSSLRRFLMQDTTVACAHLILSMGKEQLSHRNRTCYEPPVFIQTRDGRRRARRTLRPPEIGSAARTLREFDPLRVV